LELEPGEEESAGSGKVFAADVMVRLCLRLFPKLVHHRLPRPPRETQNQIFDLIRPKIPRVVTLDDLVTSGAAHIFTSVLVSRCPPLPEASDLLRSSAIPNVRLCRDLFDNWEQNDGIRVNYAPQRGPPSPPLPPHRFISFYQPEASSATERWPDPPAAPALAAIAADA
jgi:hypothetical protein